MSPARVIITGSVGLDDISTPLGSRELAPGGSAIYSSWACSYFAPVGLIGIAGEDFPPEYLRMLEERGVDTSGLHIASGKTFRWKGRYDYDFNTAHTLETQLNVMDGFSPVIPDVYKSGEYLFLANIDPAIQLEVARSIEAPALIAADTMNYWIETKKEELLEVLKLCDILFVNDSEARQLSGEPNLIRACSRIFQMGPQAVIVKQGEYGASMFCSGSQDSKGNEIFSAPSIPLDSVADPTGAGDSFAGAFMGYLASCGRKDTKAMRSAAAVGSVVASFTVEGFSLEALKVTQMESIMQRFARLREIAFFESI